MAKIEIYTTPFCGYCARAKGLLDSKGAAYEEMDVMMDEKKRAEMRERSKRSTVPQINSQPCHPRIFVARCDRN